jgi:hypothetical protein
MSDNVVTLNARNWVRDQFYDILSRVKLYDGDDATGYTQRYDQPIASKTKSQGKIEIYQSIGSSDLNGFNITRAEVTTTDTANVPVYATMAMTNMDKRVGSPQHNIGGNLVITLTWIVE